MIKGIGTDIISLDRIRLACENDRFITRNYSSEEQALFKKRSNPLESIAANFAMKEAIVKALGTGFRGLNLVDVCILRDPLGKPFVAMTPKLETKMQAHGISKITVTCSHEKTYAVAFAIAE